MDRRRMIMAMQKSSGPIPYFRLGFTNGLTPEIGSGTYTVTSVGTVTITTGSATTSNGELHITPNPFVAGAKSYRFKYKHNAVRNYSELYRDYSPNNPTRNGFEFMPCGAGTHNHVQQIVNNYGTFLGDFPTQNANVVYDIVFTTTGDTTPGGCRLYVNGELVGTPSQAPAASLTADASYGQLLEQAAAPNGFDGSIYLMEMYDRVLAADEVAALYNA